MFFSDAKMIFPSGRRTDDHVFAGFYAQLVYNGQSRAVMQISASSYYKLYINGEFISYGPARSAHEYARVDVIEIEKHLRKGQNHIAAEVIGYCGKINLADTGEAAFFIAQIDIDGVPALCTGDGSWKSYLLPQKELNHISFSHARFWVENYTLSPLTNDWRTGENPPDECETEIIPGGVSFLPRVAAFPDFSVFTCVGATYTKGIKRAEMTDEIRVFDAENESCVDYDFGVFRSGFIGLEFECTEPCEVTLMYPEKISREEGEFYSEPSGQNSHVRACTVLSLSPGKHIFETFEAYVLRYLRIIVKGARSYTIGRVFVRLCQIKDLSGGGFVCSDGEINRIYKACRTALIINTFDTFMDCAQRERGGGWNDCCRWIAPASRMMLGDMSVEKCYLENQIADTVSKYCDVAYACYPSNYRCIIHNWTIYLLLQLYEYYLRSADIRLLTENRKGIDFLVDSLNRYKNKYGLLENLPEIIYTSSYTTSFKNEPSAVYNNPISTVTNFMFAKAIGQLGELLGEKEWVDQARTIDKFMRQTVEKVSDGNESDIFPSSSIYIDEEGNPVPTGYCSEGGLYFWIMYGYFNNKNLPKKLERVFRQLGPAPDEKFSHDLYIIKRMGYEGDMFARMEALSMYGKSEMIIKEIKSYGLWAMDRFAGLLGEGWDWQSSNHHSFNAFYNYILQREILGTDNANEVEKTIKISPHTCKLSWAKGYMTTNGGICSVRWTNSGDKFSLTAEVPEEYDVFFTVPVEVTGRDRVYSLRGKEIPLPADGRLKLRGNFEFVSEKQINN
ncbi:MAG: hypothetical protein PUE85_07735 [Firmicutes bacterium]|nr:hypothetical protein [Bacillota bacterium]